MNRERRKRFSLEKSRLARGRQHRCPEFALHLYSPFLGRGQRDGHMHERVALVSDKHVRFSGHGGVRGLPGELIA